MTSRESLKIKKFLTVAFEFSGLSTCTRLNVGCVLTDMHREKFWVGYNGGPRKGRNACEREEVGSCGCIHAETNAAIKADSSIDKIAFLTDSPCELCAGALINTRVRKVYFARQYRNRDGLMRLESAGVEVHHVTGVSDYYAGT